MHTIEFATLVVPSLEIIGQSANHLDGNVPELWHVAGNTVSSAHAFDALP